MPGSNGPAALCRGARGEGYLPDIFGTTPDMKILFVCTGNTCRSPMAAARFRQLAAAAGLRNLDVQSAGVAAVPGTPVTPQARFALFQQGITLPETAVSHALTPDLVRDADFIVTMTRSHRQSVISRYPEALGKTRTLLSYAGTDADVDDPFGGDSELYVTCLAAMEPGLTALLQQLQKGTPS